MVVFLPYDLFESKGIAVGTANAHRPPHRSVREELPHTAPSLSDDGRDEYIACQSGLSRRFPLSLYCPPKCC